MKNKRNTMVERARGLAAPSAREPRDEALARNTDSREAQKRGMWRVTKQAESEPTPKGAYEKMTIKLTPAVRKMILAESLRRKSGGAANWQIQEIVSEVVKQYLVPH